MTDCEKWRETMSAYADGECGWLEGKAVAKHLRQCAACRQWLEHIHVDQQLFTQVATQRQTDISASVMEKLGEMSARPHQVMPIRAPSMRWRVLAGAAVLLMVFGVGLSVGRWAWPREVTVTQVVKVPQVREKIVKVEVPVVQEKVVVKRVPVVRTRIVYRERENPQTQPAAESKPQPVKLDEVVTRLASKPVPPGAEVREEVRPVEVVREADAAEMPPLQGGRGRPGSATTKATGTELAQVPRSSTS